MASTLGITRSSATPVAHWPGLRHLPHPMPRIPEETLQQVLAATDIVDLVGRSVKLRRAGTNWVGLCPFHNEKSPSFNVRPSTNTYHCFGCGAGGNAFRFVMEHDGLTFMEAVKRLAEQAGIRIEEEVWDANAEAAAKLRSSLIRVHQEIATWYHQLLMKHPMADAARQYLKNRGISAEVAKRWKLGYAPPNTQPLRDWAMKNKIGSGLLIEAGILATSEERGDAYPRFRHRLMFPICNDNGEVIAFSGRVLEADAKAAKYLNSPETPLFNKSKVLFGFDKAKRGISKADQAIVCEGQIDTIMLHEAGFVNSIAAQGTAFTEYHARSLKRLADEVVLCYDADNAGYKAAERAFQILVPAGIVVKVAVLPHGEDPDSLLRKEGSSGFSIRISKALDFIDYQLEVALAKRNLGEMAEKLKVAEELAANIRLFNIKVAIDTTILRVAGKLGLPEQTMRDFIAVEGNQKNKLKNIYAAVAGPNHLAKNILAAQDQTALMLCRLTVGDPELLVWMRENGDRRILEDLPGMDLLTTLWLADFDPKSQESFNSFLSNLDPGYQSAITNILQFGKPPGGLTEVRHSLQILSLSRLLQHKQKLQTQLKQPNLDPQEVADLQREIVDLHRELTELQKIVAAGAKAPV